MAQNMKMLWSLSKGAINNTLYRNAVFNVSNGRYMFTPNALRMGEYEKERHMTRAQYMPVEDTFRDKMKSICETDAGKIYMEDLKAMLYIAQQDDIPVLLKMIEKYNKNQTSRFIFGPVVMRALFFLDDANAALELYNKPECAHLFNKQTPQTILMTLLYNHAMYDSVVHVWDKLRADNPDLPTGSRSTRILLFASLAKEGTKEALEKAKSVWESMHEYKPFISREFPLYMCLLLKHNLAEEVLTEMDKTTIACRSLLHLKVMALLQLKKYEDVPQVLNEIFEIPRFSGSLIFKDLISKVMDIPDSVEVKSRIFQLLNAMPRGNKSNKTFEEFTFMPLGSVSVTPVNENRQIVQRPASFRHELLSKGL